MAIVWCTQTDITNTIDIDLASLKTDGVTRVYPDSVIAMGIRQASSIVNSHLNRFDLPETLTEIPGDLLECAVILAIWHLVRYRGFDPGAAIDNTFDRERDRVIKLLSEIASNNYHPVLSANNNMIYTNSGQTTASSVGVGGVDYTGVAPYGRRLI